MWLPAPEPCYRSKVTVLAVFVCIQVRVYLQMTIILSWSVDTGARLEYIQHYMHQWHVSCKLPGHSTLPAKHHRPTGFLRAWSVGVEFFARLLARSCCWLPSVLWHCWLGHLTHKNSSLIWYDMFGGTLNLAQLNLLLAEIHLDNMKTFVCASY